METAVLKEIARLKKQIERKLQEIEEHKELLKMWEDKLKEPKK